MSEPSTEQAILAAARELFVLRGYSGATMQAIADRAGINKAMLHYYFRSKDALFKMVLRRSIEVIAPNLEEALAADLPVLEKLQGFVRTYIAQIRRHPHIPIFILHELSQNRTNFVDEMKKSLNPSPRILQLFQALRAEQEAGRIKDFDPLHLVLSTVSMCAFPFVARPVFCNLMDISDEGFEALIDQRSDEVCRFLVSALTP